MSNSRALVSLFVGLVTLIAGGESFAEPAPPAHEPQRVGAPAKPPEHRPKVNVTLKTVPLVTQYNCQTAQSSIAAPNAAQTLDPDQYEEALIVATSCYAAGRNKLQANHSSTLVVVTPSTTAAKTDNVSIDVFSSGDVATIKEVCETAAGAAFVYAEAAGDLAAPAKAAIGAVDFVTASGKTDCDGYIDAASRGDALLIISPGSISTEGVTVHLLSMIGAQAPAGTVQAESARIDNELNNQVKTAGKQILDHPLMVLDPTAYVLIQNNKAIQAIPNPAQVAANAAQAAANAAQAAANAAHAAQAEAQAAANAANNLNPACHIPGINCH